VGFAWPASVANPERRECGDAGRVNQIGRILLSIKHLRIFKNDSRLARHEEPLTCPITPRFSAFDPFFPLFAMFVGAAVYDRRIFHFLPCLVRPDFQKLRIDRRAGLATGGHVSSFGSVLVCCVEPAARNRPPRRHYNLNLGHLPSFPFLDKIGGDLTILACAKPLLSAPDAPRGNSRKPLAM
jgi:hypothetical protein